MRLNSSRARAGACVSLGFFALLALVANPLVRAADAGAQLLSARQSPDWLRDGVIYEVFPRAFSAEGNFKGIIPQLDRLKDLGVNVL